MNARYEYKSSQEQLAETRSKERMERFANVYVDMLWEKARSESGKEKQLIKGDEK